MCRHVHSPRVAATALLWFCSLHHRNGIAVDSYDFSRSPVSCCRWHIYRRLEWFPPLHAGCNCTGLVKRYGDRRGIPGSGRKRYLFCRRCHGCRLLASGSAAAAGGKVIGASLSADLESATSRDQELVAAGDSAVLLPCCCRCVGIRRTHLSFTALGGSCGNRNIRDAPLRSPFEFLGCAAGYRGLSAIRRRSSSSGLRTAAQSTLASVSLSLGPVLPRDRMDHAKCLAANAAFV